MAKSNFRVGRSKTGLGLFALKKFRKGDYLVTYQGRKLTNPQAEELEARGNKYLFEINSRWTRDGSSRKNLARYVNHSCAPNCETMIRGHTITYEACKGIYPGDEVLVDYGKNYWDMFIKKHGCRCDACKAGGGRHNPPWLKKNKEKRRRLREAAERRLKLKKLKARKLKAKKLKTRKSKKQKQKKRR